MIRYLFSVLFLVAITSVSEIALAQSNKYYSSRVDKMEKRAQQQKPEFTIVKNVKTYPDRINATETIEISSKPNRAIATLHDFITGAPLESCLTPCQLHREPGAGYGIGFYKKWYWPKMTALKPGKFGDVRPLNMSMGMNYYEVKKKHKQCDIDFANSDKIEGDAEPCYRFPPDMPRKANKSGHCIVKFDIDQKGKPINVVAESCSDELFRRPSINSVKWWRFTPKVERGEAVPQYEAENKITFKLKGPDGIIVPEN